MAPDKIPRHRKIVDAFPMTITEGDGQAWKVGPPEPPVRSTWAFADRHATLKPH